MTREAAFPDLMGEKKMKDIIQWLLPENIHLNLKADSELGVIRTMIDIAAENAAVTDVKKVARNIIENEVYGKPHEGCCAVIFHSLTQAVAKPLLLVGRFENGFGYYSKKGHPVDLVYLVIAPPDYEIQLNQLLLRSRRLLCISAMSDKIRKAQRPEQVYEILLSYWSK